LPKRPSQDLNVAICGRGPQNAMYIQRNKNRNGRHHRIIIGIYLSQIKSHRDAGCIYINSDEEKRVSDEEKRVSDEEKMRARKTADSRSINPLEQNATEINENGGTSVKSFGGGGFPYVHVLELLVGLLVEPVAAHLPHDLIHLSSTAALLDLSINQLLPPRLPKDRIRVEDRPATAATFPRCCFSGWKIGAHSHERRSGQAKEREGMKAGRAGNLPRSRRRTGGDWRATQFHSIFRTDGNRVTWIQMGPTITPSRQIGPPPRPSGTCCSASLGACWATGRPTSSLKKEKKKNCRPDPLVASRRDRPIRRRVARHPPRSGYRFRGRRDPESGRI